MDPIKGLGRRDQVNLNPYGNNFLLLIAIDKYSKGIAPLINCVNDAEKMRNVFINDYDFDKKHTFTLFNEEATRKNILSKLKELKRKLAGNDNLVIIFSGHGCTIENNGYWIPVDAHLGEDDEYISNYDIKSRLNTIRCRHLLLIVDACFSGTIFINTRNLNIVRKDDLRSSRWGISASHSREVAFDGEVGDNSPFAKNLIRFLKENNKPCSVQKLSDYVITNVQLDTQGKQIPICRPIGFAGDDLGIFIFYPKGTSKTRFNYLINRCTENISYEILGIIYDYLKNGGQIPIEYLVQFSTISNKSKLDFFDKKDVLRLMLYEIQTIKLNPKLQIAKYYRLLEANKLDLFFNELVKEKLVKKYLQKEYGILKANFSQYNEEFVNYRLEEKRIQYNRLALKWLEFLKYLEYYKSFYLELNLIKNYFANNNYEKVFSNLFSLLNQDTSRFKVAIEKLISVVARYELEKRKQLHWNYGFSDESEVNLNTILFDLHRIITEDIERKL